MANGRLPLSRFTVLDLTGHRAGPTAVRQLADWGAKVLKVELPGEEGDSVGGSRDGADYQNLHRNKRAMSLNLKTEEGHAIFMKLAEKADVIIENYRSDVKFRLKVDYESIRKINPRIVYGSISGFGQDGPYATRPGVDQIAQGMSGIMSVTGFPGQGPVRVGAAIADLTSGMFLAQAILMALLDREMTGEGQWVHTSLLESLIYMLDFQAARWLQHGEVAGQAGNGHPTGAPTGMFKTTDGYINVAPSGKIWPRFCQAIDHPDLAKHRDYHNNSQRGKNRDKLNAFVGEVLGKESSAHWFEKMSAFGVPCGPVYTIDQTFNDPQVKHLGIAKPTDHARLGELYVVGQPIHLTATPQPDRLNPTPDSGEHTDAVLTELGYSTAQIADLHVRRVV